MKCPWCGITVPDMPEDATLEETLCNQCFEDFCEEEGDNYEEEDN